MNTEREKVEQLRAALPQITPLLTVRQRIRLRLARVALSVICITFVLAWCLVAPLLDPDARRKAKARIDA